MARVIGACGLVCSDCDAYKATKLNDARAIERVAAEWAKLYGVEVLPEHVWCDGCLSPGTHRCHHTTECEVRACVVKRLHGNCAACRDYPCPTLKTFFDAVPAAKQTLDELRAK